MANQYPAGGSAYVINGTGEISIGGQDTVQWFSRNGPTSCLTIKNRSTSEPLALVLSGAPSEVVTSKGDPLNGKHTLNAAPISSKPSKPSKVPDFELYAQGDFGGKTIVIFDKNQEDGLRDCFIQVTASS